MKKNEKRKTNKKLLSAFGMFMLSGAMLGSATYAWFTMSREVEVKNIQMTATVPEDLQLSIGALTDGELNKDTGILTGGTASAPAKSTDWSNTADISKYYEMGKIIPASSTTGANIYFTPDADGVGKTVAGEASYYAAALGLTAQADANTASSGTYMTTLHAATTTEKPSGSNAITTPWLTSASGYTASSAWDKTNDDGYYVDIPIWIRSSAGTAVNLKVEGYVVPKGVNKAIAEADIELYKAARIAILNGETVTVNANDTTGAVATTAGTAVQANNVIPLHDGVDLANCTKDGNGLITALAYAQDKYSGASVLDSVNYTGRVSGATVGNLYAVSALGTGVSKADGTGTYIPGTYSEYSAYSSTATAPATTNVVATIAAPAAGEEYGAPKKLVLRVWLDGEDGECWNKNAGQDFSINLKFSKVE